MKILKSFIQKLCRGRVCLEPARPELVKMSVVGTITIRKGLENGISISIVLVDGTRLMGHRVKPFNAGETITIKNVRIIQDIIID